jgi:hypothetical protein
MDKTVIGFDEREMQTLNVILADQDKDAALDFLRDVVMGKIKSIPKDTGCHPRYED